MFGKQKKKSFDKKYSHGGIIFKYDGDNQIQFPLNNNSPEIIADLLRDGEKWAELEMIWSDGFLEDSGFNTWKIPYKIYENYIEEDNSLFEYLELPLPKDLEIEVQSHSHVGDPAFRISIESYLPDFGPLREDLCRRYGAVFFLAEDRIIPFTVKQKELFDAAKGEEVDWTSLEERMAYLARVKKAGLSVNAKFDGYLQNEDYEFRSDVGIDLREESNDEITLIPRIDGIEDYGVKSGEDLVTDSPPKVLTKAVTPTKRKRLIIDKEIRDSISKLPPGGKIKGANVPRLLTNPEQIIPEGFDLSLFSERVKGIKIRVYNSRPYLHVNKSSGGWFEGIPGIGLEDWSPLDDSNDDFVESIETGISRETYQELAKQAREQGEEYIQYEGSWIRIDPDEAEKFEKVINSFDENEGGKIKIPAGSMLEIYENLELLEFIDKSTIVDDDQLPSDLPNIEIPPTFCGELFPYQFAGFLWLGRLSNHGIGGLLADEMGLGKTVQAIAHLLSLKHNGVGGPNLLVVPKTLIDNWKREIKLFSQSELSVYSYDGNSRIFNPDFINSIDVVLTTYDTLRRDQAKLGTIEWTMVICDEAQYAKNPTAQRTSALKAMKSKHRAALTGTPVENGLIEFWCIMDFVQPGLLGSWSQFRTEYERPIVEGEEEERENKVVELLKKIRGYYLRRLKSEYLKDLPPKNVVFREVSFGEMQFDRYLQIAKEGKYGGKGAALAAIGKLIRLCAHPMALDSAQISGDILKVSCPKLDETISIIRDVKNRSEKVIIFTDFKVIQRVLQKAISENFGLWPDIINGEVNDNRQLIIDVFSQKEGFNVIILGHQVAGVGLNITSANHVIHYTRPWNPAKESQATDRVHRIGQKKPVNIYYPYIKDDRFVTVEERLDQLLRSKEGLAHDVLMPSSELNVKVEELLDCVDIDL